VFFIFFGELKASPLGLLQTAHFIVPNRKHSCVTIKIKFHILIVCCLYGMRNKITRRREVGYVSPS